MNNFEMNLSVFDRNLQFAVDKLHNKEFEEAYKMIINTICINPNAPEPHNLLGLWYEMNGDEQLARKHYRAAYVLDPTYKPACNNLERISTFFITKAIPYDFGDIPEKEELKERGI
ncbi:MAG: hypothetical protein WCD89_04210 [Anaerocolumna sp.]